LRDKTGNIPDAKNPRPIGRAGKPVAQSGPARKAKGRFKLHDDPLLHAQEYSHDGPIGPTANQDIDRSVYGI
jgi:hypothetical protein